MEEGIVVYMSELWGYGHGEVGDLLEGGRGGARAAAAVRECGALNERQRAAESSFFQGEGE